MTRFKEGARIDRALESGRPAELRWAIEYARTRITTAATERHRRHWESVARKNKALVRSADQVEAIRRQIKRESGASSEILAQVEELVASFPEDPDVWVLRGDAIQLGDGTGHPLVEARRSYERALALDPAHQEAAEEMRHFRDVHGSGA